MKILFINHNAERCGVADYGRRLFDILSPHMDITASDTEQEGYDTILYNYHYATTPVRKMAARQIALFHEAHLNFEFDKVIAVQDLPRPLFEGIGFPEKYKPNFNTPVIGSFGFGFDGKGYQRICQMVADQFDRAEIRFQIPFAQFGDNTGELAKSQIEKCRQFLPTDGRIIVEYSHDFLAPIELLHFLNSNDINLFLYEPSHGRGISSTIDYALSAKRPIGVSNSEMFRHLPGEICVDNISIPELIAKGIEPLREVYKQNSNERLVQKIKDLVYVP